MRYEIFFSPSEYFNFQYAVKITSMNDDDLLLLLLGLNNFHLTGYYGKQKKSLQ